MLKTATGLSALLCAALSFSAHAGITQTVSGVTFTVSADEDDFTRVVPYEGTTYSAFSLSREMDDLPTTPFSIDISSALTDVDLYATIDVVRPWIPPNVILFSAPSSSLSTSVSGGTRVPGTHTFNFSSGASGLTAMLSVDLAQAFGGIGLAPAVGSNCDSIDCMVPFTAAKTLVVNFWITKREVPAPIPEPEGAAIALTGLASIGLIRRLKQQQRKPKH